jgi:hypothetical protein
MRNLLTYTDWLMEKTTTLKIGDEITVDGNLLRIESNPTLGKEWIAKTEDGGSVVVRYDYTNKEFVVGNQLQSDEAGIQAFLQTSAPTITI